MSEYHINTSTVIETKHRNEQVRSWVYAMISMLCMLWGLNAYSEVRPYFAIVGIMFAAGSMMASRLTTKFSAKYFALAFLVGCILEIIAGFMF